MAGGFRRYTTGNAGFAIVEVIGRPASGKSQLTASLGTLAGWAAMSPTPDDQARCRILSPFAALACSRFSLTLLAALATRKNVNIRHYHHALTVIRRFNALAKIHGPGLHVVDEGPVHALFTTFFGTTPTPVSHKHVQRLLKMITARRTSFVMLDVPAEECLQHALSRDLPISDFTAGMNENLARIFLDDRTYEEILEGLETLPNAKVVRFTGPDAALAYLKQRSLTDKPLVHDSS